MIGRSFFSVITDKRGAVAIVMALAFPVVVGMAGLGVEAGKWFLVKRQAQTAADAAAFAGALELALELAANGSGTVISDTVRSAAREDAKRNGFTHGINPTVDVFPYTYKGNSNAVEVIVTRDETRLFSAIYLSAAARIVARAVGLVNASNPACILALNPSQPEALKVTGSAELNMENCSLGSNSTASNSMSFWGSGAVQAPSAWAAGGIVSGGSSLPNLSGGTWSYAQAIPDPYADLDFTIPSLPTCNHNNFKTSSPKNNPLVTMDPGVYCGGITISGGGNNGSENGNNITEEYTENVVLNPGTYYINKGDFEVKSNVVLICNCATPGSGVTIVLTTSGTNFAQIGSVNINANAKITLRAPAPSPPVPCSIPSISPSCYPYPGKLFIQDPRAETKLNGAGQNQFNGGADLNLTGLLYFPSQTVAWSGNSATQSCTQIIANTVTFTGNTNLTNIGCKELGLESIIVTYASLVE